MKSESFEANNTNFVNYRGKMIQGDRRDLVFWAEISQNQISKTLYFDTEMSFEETQVDCHGSFSAFHPLSRRLHGITCNFMANHG